jgi:DNA repair exonuclease SbcCD nuclease subunit
MPFRFVHTADIHLDSPLKSLALRDPALAALVDSATRQTFERIVDLCLDERVDALLIAGDLYDGDQTSMKTAAFLGAQLRTLSEAGIRVCLIRGNHDARSRITKQLDLPDSVQTYSTRTAEVLKIPSSDGAPAIAIHGTSFPSGSVPNSLLPRFDGPIADHVNIGMLHASPDGSEGHDVYAPVAIADLAAHGFDYWALGHIHQRNVYHDDPLIVMPGIPQGRHVNEAGAKSVTLATVHDDRRITLEERNVSVAEFARSVVDATGLESWSDVRQAIDSALHSLTSSKHSEHIIARIALSGGTPLAWRLRRDADLLLEEARTAASDVWIEGLEVDCAPPEATSAVDAGAVAELSRLMTGIAASPEFLQRAEEEAEALLRALPREARDVFGSGEDAVADELAALAKTGADEVLARLASPRGEAE